MLQMFLRDSAKYLLLKAVVSVSWLLMLRELTANLSPSEYGEYSILNSVMSYALVLSGAWLTSAILRFYPAARLQPLGLALNVGRLLGRSLLFGAILFLPLHLLVVRILDLEAGPSVASVLILLFILSTWLACNQSWLRASLSVTRHVRVSSLQTLLGLGASILFLKAGLGIMGVFAGQALAAAWALWSTRDLGIAPNASRPGTEEGLAKAMLRYGWPIVAINVFTQILSTADQLVLKYLGHASEVGIYSANYMLAQNTIFAVTSVISAAVAPRLFHHWESGQKDLARGLMIQVTLLFCCASAPLVGAMVFFSRPIAEWSVAPAYWSGSSVIPWVSSGAFFVGLGNIFSELLTLRKRTGELMLCYAIAAVINLGLNFLLIPARGMHGAAVATLVGYASLCVLILVAATRTGGDPRQ
jgi:O-antigen/teichoic acid export membrane protein